MGAFGQHANAPPVPKGWDEFFDNPNYQVSEDFMADYQQPPEQDRDWWS